jgi:hypothetical protein
MVLTLTLQLVGTAELWLFNLEFWPYVLLESISARNPLMLMLWPDCLQ